jgi:hypothetical protein
MRKNLPVATTLDDNIVSKDTKTFWIQNILKPSRSKRYKNLLDPKDTKTFWIQNYPKDTKTFLDPKDLAGKGY